MARRRNGNQGDDDVPVQTQAQVVEQFRRFTPLSFNGREGPTFVDEWFMSLERTFELIGCTDAQRILCAQFQMIEDAGRWWISYWRLRPAAERAYLTWDRFKELVMEQYYPQHFREKMEREFWNLEQGEMTVGEYERKFNQISLFVEHMVDTDRKRTLKFRGGLRPSIRHIIAGHGLLPYTETVIRAQEIEASHALSLQLHLKLSTRKRNQVEDSNENENPSKQARIEDDIESCNPTCDNCGRIHKGVCLFGKNVCYRCKEPGHASFECPLREKDRQDSRCK